MGIVFAAMQIILMILSLYKIVLIAMIIMSWLFTFNIINAHNQIVDTIWRIINSLTEPLLKPIRKFLPNMGGLDLSPIILFLAIYFVEYIISYYSAALFR